MTEVKFGKWADKSKGNLEAFIIDYEVLKKIGTDKLLMELKDRGVIRSWYYNGTYHIGNELPH